MFWSLSAGEDVFLEALRVRRALMYLWRPFLPAAGFITIHHVAPFLQNSAVAIFYNECISHFGLGFRFPPGLRPLPHIQGRPAARSFHTREARFSVGGRVVFHYIGFCDKKDNKLIYGQRQPSPGRRA